MISIHRKMNFITCSKALKEIESSFNRNDVIQLHAIEANATQFIRAIAWPIRTILKNNRL